MLERAKVWTCVCIITIGSLGCSSDPLPRRTVTTAPDGDRLTPSDADSDTGDSETQRTTPPERVTSWLESHPTCVGDGEAIFEDATLSSGAWHYQNRADSDDFYDQMVGGGVALADFDNDADLDLYIGVAQGPNVLLVNDGAGHFTEAATNQDVAFDQDWTNGVSAADFDNDGDQDLYLSNRGPDRLLENRGELVFVDVTREVGINSRGNSATASWGDLNGDGWLDFVVAKLADSVDGERIDRELPAVYIADGEGGFDRLDSRSLTNGSSFIAPIVDLDGDTDEDILLTQEFYVLEPASIVENLGTTADDALDWRVQERGGFDLAAPATMGVAILDLNGDELPDIYTTNLWGEPYEGEVLAVNRGALSFENVAESYDAQPMTGSFDVTGITRAVSWAAIAADFRNVGREDLFVAYGQLVDEVEGRDPASYPPLYDKQPDALLLRTEADRFELAEGSCAESTGDSRGAAVGDIDDDGCLDLVVVPREGSTRLLLNRCEDRKNYVSIDLEGTESNRDAIGSTVVLRTSNRTQRRWVTGSSTSVFSSSPRRVHFGLGDETTIERIDVVWPDGKRTAIEDVDPNRTIDIEQPD